MNFWNIHTLMTIPKNGLCLPIRDLLAAFGWPGMMVVKLKGLEMHVDARMYRLLFPENCASFSSEVYAIMC